MREEDERQPVEKVGCRRVVVGASSQHNGGSGGCIGGNWQPCCANALMCGRLVPSLLKYISKCYQDPIKKFNICVISIDYNITLLLRSCNTRSSSRARKREMCSVFSGQHGLPMGVRPPARNGSELKEGRLPSVLKLLE